MRSYIKTGHRFFLLKDFYKTNFKNTSPGGFFRVRYFNIKDILKALPENVSDIATQLRDKTWN